MVQGIKSKEFGCIWKTMFIVAMCFPEKFNKNCKSHIQKLKHYKSFYYSLQFIIPCKFCRDFMQNNIVSKFPLNFSGRIPLMYSIYTWKDAVNQKLINQGHKIKPSPSFSVILNHYETYRAKCDKNKGNCI